jgi:hypothetical protein
LINPIPFDNSDESFSSNGNIFEVVKTSSSKKQGSKQPTNRQKYQNPEQTANESHPEKLICKDNPAKAKEVPAGEIDMEDDVSDDDAQWPIQEAIECHTTP